MGDKFIADLHSAIPPMHLPLWVYSSDVTSRLQPRSQKPQSRELLPRWMCRMCIWPPGVLPHALNHPSLSQPPDWDRVSYCLVFTSDVRANHVKWLSSRDWALRHDLLWRRGGWESFGWEGGATMSNYIGKEVRQWGEYYCYTMLLVFMICKSVDSSQIVRISSRGFHPWKHYW